MRIWKRLLAVGLCLVMLPFSMLVVSAQDAEPGEVLYYQLFDQSFGLTSLAEAGLTNKDNECFQLENDGYLSVNAVGDGKR